jgi:uncharacterized protein YbaP (TraB family)
LQSEFPMKKTGNLIALMLWVVFSSACVEKNSTSINVKVFEIREPQGVVLGYLLGSTHRHPSNIDVSTLSGQLLQLSPAPKGLFLETKTRVDIRSIKNAMLPSGKTTLDYVATEKHDDIRELFRVIRKFKKDNDWPLENIHPALLAPTWNWVSPTDKATDTNSEKTAMTTGGLDSLLTDLARKSSWSIESLEDSSELFSALAKGDVAAYSNCLYGYSMLLESKQKMQQNRAVRAMRMQAFIEQNLQLSYDAAIAYYSEVLSCSSDTMRAEMLYRNQAMVDKIERVTSTQHKVAVFAPGLAHLGGGEGIIEILRARGYVIVERTR